MSDIRQSQNWAEYIKKIGWEYTVIDDIYIYHKKLGILNLIKIQRPENLTKEKITKIITWARSIKAPFIKIEPLTKEGEAVIKEMGFERNFFPLVCPSTAIIDLTKSIEDIYKEFSSDAKYSLKRAEKNNIEVEFFVNPSPEILDKFMNVLTEVGQEKKFYIQPKNEIQIRIETFKDNCIISLAKVDNKYLSASLIQIFEKTAYYMLAATTTEGKKLRAADKHMFETIRYLKNFPELNLKTFDLEGVTDERFPVFTKTWEGFSYFKRKYATEVIKFPPPYILIFSNTLKLLKRLTGVMPI